MEANMTQRIAIMLIHGIGDQDPEYVPTATRSLTERIYQDCDDRAIVRVADWSDVLQPQQNDLIQRLRSSPMDFDALRAFVISFLGDAIAYQPSDHDRHAYETIHGILAATLHDLAQAAGPDAPLIIIAHSLGGIITSNFIWDLQHTITPDVVRAQMGDTPLERGETLTAFYTLGCAFPLWALRFKDFGAPIAVPAPDLARHHPTLTGEWVNYYDRDDVFGYPLKPINDAYAQVVTEDREVNVGRFYESWNPLSHLAYWRDNDVIRPLAAAVGRVVKALPDG
jgi:hypothetical protein